MYYNKVNVKRTTKTNKTNDGINQYEEENEEFLRKNEK